MFVRATAVLFGLTVLAAPAHADAIIVDCSAGPNFTIQDGVFAAVNGDTVVVHPCTPFYNENVSLAGLDDIHLVAAEAFTTDHASYATGIGSVTAPGVIIDGTTLLGPCVSIAGSSSVSISGFRLQNCTTGVDIQQSFDTVVHGNRIQNQTFAGVLDANTGGTVIAGNLIGFSDYGIVLQGTRESRVLDNWVANNTSDGVLVEGDRAMVTNNRVQGSSATGIHLLTGDSVRVERNDTYASTLDNLVIEAPVVAADAIGNFTDSSLLDLSLSDLAENL